MSAGHDGHLRENAPVTGTLAVRELGPEVAGGDLEPQGQLTRADSRLDDA